MPTMTANPTLYLPSDALPPGMADGQMGAVPSQMAPVDPTHAMTAPLGPAPQPLTMAPGGEKPKPTKMSPLDQQEEHQQSHLMADYQKDADPYGSPDNHPGFMGKLLHGLNVATGGVNRRQWEEQGLGKQIQGLEAEKSKEGLEGATAGHLNEETSEMPDKTQSEEDLQGAQTEHTKAETGQIQNPQDTNPDMATYRSLVKMGMRPSEALQEIERDKSLALKPAGTKEALQSQLVAAQNAGDTATATKLQKQLKDIDPMGEQRVVIQQQNAANANNRQTDAATEREYTYARGKWDKDLQTYNSQNEKLQEASGFIGKGALGDALGAIKSLSGLASGQGSGVRITQAELNSIAHARGLGGDFQAALQKFGDGRNLTPQQEVQLKGILSSVQHIAQIKESIINQGLDDLSNATDKASVRKIDSQLRHALMGGQ